jgi:predicted CoA-binding protein
MEANLRSSDPSIFKELSMTAIRDAASEFLAHKRVAVTGVSRTPGNHGSNVVYKRLRERGYQVFAVNPNASEVEGDPAYHDLRSIPDGVDAVVIGTRPERSEETMRECADLGIKHVWMHRGPGGGSVSDAATAYGREHGITVIDGGCPCMFGTTADPGHKAMRFLFTMRATSRDRSEPRQQTRDRGCPGRSATPSPSATGGGRTGRDLPALASARRPRPVCANCPGSTSRASSPDWSGGNRSKSTTGSAPGSFRTVPPAAAEERDEQ